jgi:hypothetical protein
MKKGFDTCDECGKSFKVCKFNAYHQKYCMRTGCIHKRKKRRQREYQNKRYHTDDEYREKKRKAACKNARQRRSKNKFDAKFSKKKQTKKIEINPLEVLMGVVAQLTDECNPAIVHERLLSYEIRGRQLSYINPIYGVS